jgi:hypothetical protein
LFKEQLDVEGYNYMEAHYAEDHAAHPDRVMYGSENKADVASWLVVANTPYISAQYLWTGIDYMGEASKFPNRSSGDGFIDMAGFPKPVFYFRKSLWNDAPMVKLMPDDSGTLVCYTNADSVEFFQNGNSLGEAKLPEDRIIKAPETAADGPIKAVAKKNGAEVAEDTYTSPGRNLNDWNLALREYKTSLGSGDGPNVAQIELAITDSSGNVLTDAAQDVAVSIAGPGRLLTMESGDINSLESYQASHRKVFHGRMVIYVETHGPVEVTAKATGKPAARIAVGN